MTKTSWGGGWSRRLQRRPGLLGLGALAVTACEFYDLRYEPCLDSSSAQECGLGGDSSDTTLLGTGSSGAQGNGSGGDSGATAGGGGSPPAGSGGGSSVGGMETSGGAQGTSSGGRPFGTGGDGGAGRGGASSGGGGSGGGGSGGGDTGTGTGGGSGGGDTGTGGVLTYTPTINEIKASGKRFIEIYNAGGGPISANTLFVTAGTPTPDLTNRCALPTELLPGEYAIIATGGSTVCDEVTVPCRLCLFALQSGVPSSTVYLQDEAQTALQTVKLPDSGDPSAPTALESWAAVPDGSGAFSAQAPSPGLPN